MSVNALKAYTIGRRLPSRCPYLSTALNPTDDTSAGMTVSLLHHTMLELDIVVLELAEPFEDISKLLHDVSVLYWLNKDDNLI